MTRFLSYLIVGISLPMAAAALGEKPVLVPPYKDTPCWVSVFDGQNFQPPSARLTGPTFLEKPETGPVVAEDLRHLGGENFIDRIDSLIVGPRARITVYDEVNFSGHKLSFEANARIPDLAVYDFNNRIRSIKVECD
ncbi:MAG: hypothetical protein V5B33_03640 [Candidatus Accumulibacter sp. UW20]|jgi:hypothetical protein